MSTTFLGTRPDGRVEAPAAPGLDPKTRDSLRQAKALVAIGWFKCFPHRQYGETPQHCVITALTHVDATDRAWELVSAACAVKDTWMIADWNNAEERTWEEAVGIFDKVLTKNA